MEKYGLSFPEIKKYQVISDKMVYGSIVQLFVEALQKDRGTQTHYVKNGKKIKLSPITFISVRMQLQGIKEIPELSSFLNDCERHTGFKNFSQYFHYKLK